MSVSKKLRFDVFARDGFICRYCGYAAPDVVLEVDHVVPRSAGGADEAANLVTACVACNRGKSDTPLSWEEFEALSPEPPEIYPVTVEYVGGPVDGHTAEVRVQAAVFWCFRTATGYTCIPSSICTARDGRQFLGYGSVALYRDFPDLREATLVGFYEYVPLRAAGGRCLYLQWMTPEEFILGRLGAL